MLLTMQPHPIPGRGSSPFLQAWTNCPRDVAGFSYPLIPCYDFGDMETTWKTRVAQFLFIAFICMGLIVWLKHDGLDLADTMAERSLEQCNCR